MEIEFKDKKLALIESDEAVKTKLPISIIKACRKKILILRSVVDERDLRNIKSLHYKKLKGERTGQHSIRISGKFRLIFTLIEQQGTPKVSILEVIDYH